MIGLPRPDTNGRKGELWLDARNRLISDQDDPNETPETEMLSRTRQRRELLQKLNGRSNGAVELEHQNISAVLRDLNCFWIPGYKPRSNY